MRGGRALRGIFGEMLDKLLGKVKKFGERGPGHVLPVRPRMSLSEAAAKAEKEASAYADHVKATKRARDRPTAATAAVDRRTGKVYTGHSGEIRGKHGAEPREVPQEIDARIPDPSRNEYPRENCGEVSAATRAVEDGADVDDLVFHTKHVRTKQTMPPCENCEAWVITG